MTHPAIDMVLEGRDCRHDCCGAKGRIIERVPRCEVVFDGCRCTYAAGHGGNYHAPAIISEREERAAFGLGYAKEESVD